MGVEAAQTPWQVIFTEGDVRESIKPADEGDEEKQGVANEPGQKLENKKSALPVCGAGYIYFKTGEKHQRNRQQLHAPYVADTQKCWIRDRSLGRSRLMRAEAVENYQQPLTRMGSACLQGKAAIVVTASCGGLSYEIGTPLKGNGTVKERRSYRLPAATELSSRMACTVSGLGALPISTFLATSQDRRTSSITSSSDWSMSMGMPICAHDV